MTGFGQFIRGRRAELKMTQSQLAGKAQVSARTVWSVEHHDHQPNPATLQMILNALGVRL
jgi:transcriptional regulator with XRE-family HTH domain